MNFRKFEQQSSVKKNRPRQWKIIDDGELYSTYFSRDTSEQRRQGLDPFIALSTVHTSDISIWGLIGEEVHELYWTSDNGLGSEKSIRLLVLKVLVKSINGNLYKYILIGKQGCELYEPEKKSTRA